MNYIGCSKQQAILGFEKVAKHVENLIESALRLVFDSQEFDDDGIRNGYLRSSLILELIAIDETGKLIDYWHACSKAAENCSDRVLVPVFGHAHKGIKVNDIFNRASSILNEQFKTDTNSNDIPEIINILDDGFKRLAEVGKKIEKERARAMYVDPKSDGTWTDYPEISPDELISVGFTILLFKMISVGVIEKTDDFELAVKAIHELETKFGFEATQKLFRALQNDVN
jgi:hypothetical protein